jgi:hypothetical protein
VNEINVADDLCSKRIYRNENLKIEHERKVCGTNSKILVSVLIVDIDDPLKQYYEL